MVIHQIIALLAFVVVVAALLVRYVANTVDREFRNLARSETDLEYRDAEMQRVARTLEGFPAAADPKAMLPKPSPRWVRTLPALLIMVGGILWWGGVLAPRGEARQYYLAVAVAVAAAVVMLLANVRRRRSERLVILLRYEADLRRLAGDHETAVVDLERILRLTPWDDSTWAELSDEFAAVERFSEASAAMRRAIELDPGYEDYHAQGVSLALRMDDAATARQLFARWSETLPERDDAGRAKRLTYRAAVFAAEGDEAGTRKALSDARAIDEDALWLALDLDSGLEGARTLMEAPSG